LQTVTQATPAPVLFFAVFFCDGCCGHRKNFRYRKFCCNIYCKTSAIGNFRCKFYW